MVGNQNPRLSRGATEYQMNIALRPSGGRGEYELAGKQGELCVSDLLGRAMFIETLPGIAINAFSKCLEKDGKPRIRLTNPAKNAHPSAFIAAAMMLPGPRRERHRTHGADLLRWSGFVVQTVRINVIIRADGSVLVSPLTVRLENADDVRLDISFAERMARVVRVWVAAATTEDHVALAVRAHAAAFASTGATQAQLVAAGPALRAVLGNRDGDMLPLLEKRFGISAISAPSVGGISAEITEEDFAEEVEHVAPADVRIERVRQWRLAAVRGGSSSAFRRNIMRAYNSRCMFSGRRLPRTEATTTAGVDAAHILPWSRYDLDATPNGICLSKECHWAFDSGLFRLSFDDAENVYVVSIPAAIRPAALKAKFDLGSFEAIAGAISRNNLPANEAFWPSSAYLGELNRFLDGKAE
jgi:hypothetical protein